MELMTPMKVFRTPQRHVGPVAPGKPDHAYRAYELLYLCFIVAPIAAGVDKFFNYLTEWSNYLAPSVEKLLGPSDLFMKGVGLVEIAAGLLVLVKPRAGALVVTAWLWGIIVNLLLLPGYYDIALRDFGLSLAALALYHLAAEYQRQPSPA
jgi:hypothetical protein